MKRLISIISLTSFGLLSFAQLAAADLVLGDKTELLNEETQSYFTDVEVPNILDYEDDMEAYYQAMGTMVLTMQLFGQRGLVGYEAEDGSYYYNPNAGVTRAEVAKFFAVFRNDPPDLSWGRSEKPGEHFTDFEGLFAQEWYVNYASALKRVGDISGYPDGTFRATNNINGAELSKFINNVYGLSEQDESGATWYENYVQAGKDFNVLPEDFDPAAEVTRGEMAGYIMRAAVVQHFGSEEPFTDRLLTAFIEDKGRASIALAFLTEENSDMFYGYNFIFHQTDDVRIASIINDGSQESVTLMNEGESNVDLSGYYITLLDRTTSSDFEHTDVSYTFPEGTVLAPAETLSVYSMTQADHIFENGFGDSGNGVLDDIFGNYAFLLYNDHAQLIDVVAFET